MITETLQQPTRTNEAERIAGFAAPSGYAPSHRELVKRAGAWLRNRKNCGVVMEELATQNNETPDAIGFYGAGGSILVECKTSRSDYLADKNKIFRRFDEMGMGDARYFAAPKGIIRPDELLEGWGLLEVGEHQIREIKEATHKPANKRAEVKMLMSAIRRLEISTAVFVREEHNDKLTDRR